jgi:hypothetical protein
VNPEIGDALCRIPAEACNLRKQALEILVDHASSAPPEFPLDSGRTIPTDIDQLLGRFLISSVVYTTVWSGARPCNIQISRSAANS